MILVVLLGIGLFIFIQTLKPSYEGELDFVGLETESKVYFDTYGIPHIYASTEEDALRVLGYVHAQDRLWQMELLRRVAPGRLSQVFGKQLLQTDRFFISLGIDEASKETVNDLNPSDASVRMAQAYLEGINEFIENGPTPVEFYLTGIDKTPFTLTDIHNAIGYMAFSFAMGLKTDPLLSDIKNSLGPAYLADLEIDIDPATELIQNYPADSTSGHEIDLVASVHKSLENLPVPQFIGSNSWVLAPEKTKQGAVILANDPHIGFAQPSVWYEAHLITPEYEKYGYHLAGIPFPLLAHNRQLAYGLTMFENDDMDFYYETLNPQNSEEYLNGNSYKTFENVSSTIKIKDSADVVFDFKRTHRGPVLNDIAQQINGEKTISLSWIYTQRENRLLESLYRISHATDIDEFRSGLPMLHAPGLNVMYGDAEGNIAWWATAHLYRYRDSLNSKLIMDGSSGKDEPLEYLEFDQNPQALNPPWNYVYSANNQPDTIGRNYFPGYYLPENRAKRIVGLLENGQKWGKEDVSDMMTDVVSAVNSTIVRNLLNDVDLKEFEADEAAMLDELMQWNGSNDLKDREPVVYHRWIYYLLKNTFEDELGEERFNQLLRTHLLKRVIAPMSAKEHSIWWDDINTAEDKETRNAIVNLSLKHAFESLKTDLGADTAKWNWSKVHKVEYKHPIGEVDMCRSFFNVGPYPVNGTREVINNMAFHYDSLSTYQVHSGPSTRRVIDFSDIENGLSILPTGQSGNPFSEHYDDQAEMYLKGVFRKMMMNKEEIRSTSKSLLIFKPKK